MDVFLYFGSVLNVVAAVVEVGLQRSLINLLELDFGERRLLFILDYFKFEFSFFDNVEVLAWISLLE